MTTFIIFFITPILRVPVSKHHPLHQAPGVGGLGGGSAHVTAGPERPPVLKRRACRGTGATKAIGGAALSAGRLLSGPFCWERAEFTGLLVVRTALLHGSRRFIGSQSHLPHLQRPCQCQMPPRCSAALPKRAPALEPPRDTRQERVGWGRGLGSGSAPSPVATPTSLLLLTEPVSKACPASKEVSVEDKSSSSNYGTGSFI